MKAFVLKTGSCGVAEPGTGACEVQQHSWEGAVIATPTGRARHAGATYFTISLPVSTAIVGCDSVQQLEQNVQLAREFTPLSPHRMTALRAKAEPVAKPALFFRFVTRG